MTMEDPPFEDVFPNEKLGDHVRFQGVPPSKFNSKSCLKAMKIPPFFLGSL